MSGTLTGRKLEVVAAVALTLAALGILTIRLTGASEPSKSAIAVQEVWARPTPGSSANGAAYMRVENLGAAADRLLSVRSPVSERAELHHTIRDNGIMRMRAVEGGVDIPAGGTLAFAPGGYHVMLTGLASPLKAGQSFALVLTFETAGEIRVEGKVAAGPPGAEHKH